MFEIGMDFSTLAEVEALGGNFYENGQKRDLLEILANSDVGAARIRLWNNPYDENGKPYGAGTCDFDCVAALAKRVKKHGMRFMLDFHYSDFWCDPAKQCTPKAWKGFSLEQLCNAVSEYTSSTLQKLNEMGLQPDYVQVGNEITNGMLWPVGKLIENSQNKNAVRTGYDELAALLKAGCNAVRQNSNAKIILHLENSSNNALWREWFDEVTARGIDFDNIGASYYPLWHGKIETMCANMNDMAARYDKDILIVETAYPFTGEKFDESGGEQALVIHSGMTCFDGSPLPFPLTQSGQADFMAELIKGAKAIKNNRCKGIYYWEPAWLDVAGTTWATQEAREYINETHKAGGNEWANQCLFDYDGNALPALEAIKECVCGNI